MSAASAVIRNELVLTVFNVQVPSVCDTEYIKCGKNTSLTLKQVISKICGNMIGSPNEFRISNEFQLNLELNVFVLNDRTNALH